MVNHPPNKLPGRSPYVSSWWLPGPPDTLSWAWPLFPVEEKDGEGCWAQSPFPASDQICPAHPVPPAPRCVLHTCFCWGGLECRLKVRDLWQRPPQSAHKSCVRCSPGEGRSHRASPSPPVRSPTAAFSSSRALTLSASHGGRGTEPGLSLQAAFNGAQTILNLNSQSPCGKTASHWGLSVPETRCLCGCVSHMCTRRGLGPVLASLVHSPPGCS